MPQETSRENATMGHRDAVFESDPLYLHTQF